MDVVKFLLEIGHLSHHAYSEELLDNDIGQSVIVGRVLSFSTTQLNSGPLKCVSISEEPPLHLRNKRKNVVNLFLRNEYATLDVELGVLVAVNPGALSKAKNDLLQAAVGFNRKGKMWIHGSTVSAAVDPSTSGEKDVPGRVCCKGECFCGMAGWCPTPFLNVNSRTMTLKEASSHSASSFNLSCKVLKAVRVQKKHAVIRVTDGTLYKFPVLFFDGLGFGTKSLMDQEVNFVDVYVSEIGDRLRDVKEDVVLKLRDVEIGKFNSGSGEYHCFRTSGDPKKFKILPKTDPVHNKVDRPTETQAESARVVLKRKEIACQTDSNFSMSSDTDREGRWKTGERGDRKPKRAAVAETRAGSSRLVISPRKGSRRLFHPSQQQVEACSSRWPLSAPEPLSTENRNNKRSREVTEVRKILKRNRNQTSRDSSASGSSSDERFLEDSLPLLTSVCKLNEIRQGNQDPAARPTEGAAQEALQGGGTANRCGCPVSNCRHRSQNSSAALERSTSSSDDEPSLNLHISESPVEAAALRPRCDRDSCEMVPVNTLDISQLPYEGW